MLSTFDAPLVLAVLLVGLGGCKRAEAVSDAFALEASLVRAMTAPRGTRLVESGEVNYQQLRVSQEWRVEPHGLWPEYSAAVTRALASYRCSSDTAELRCSRSSPGDYFQLSLTLESGSSPPAVRARFEARPD